MLWYKPFRWLILFLLVMYSMSRCLLCLPKVQLLQLLSNLKIVDIFLMMAKLYLAVLFSGICYYT